MGPDVLTFPHIQYFNNISGMRIFFRGGEISLSSFSFNISTTYLTCAYSFDGKYHYLVNIVLGRPTNPDGNIRRRSVWYYQHINDIQEDLSLFYLSSPWESPSLSGIVGCSKPWFRDWVTDCVGYENFCEELLSNIKEELSLLSFHGSLLAL